MSVIVKDPGASAVDDVRRIAHDLRGPLNAMRLSLDLLRRGLDRDGVSEEELRKGQLKEIERLDRQVTAMDGILSRMIETALEHDEGSES